MNGTAYLQYPLGVSAAIVFTHISRFACFFDTPPGELRNKRVSSRKEPTFPMKLHQMLSDPDAEGVIVWLPHGRAWKLVKADQFERVLLPRYFDHGNISSFMRQVNGWDFRRVVKGVDEQSYYHEVRYEYMLTDSFFFLSSFFFE
jgi:hypothetical protein